METRTPEDIARDIVRVGRAERRLLARERRAERAFVDAERRLAAEEAQFDRARRRLEKRRAAVDEAAARLRRRQDERAAGPVLGPGKDRA